MKVASLARLMFGFSGSLVMVLGLCGCGGEGDTGGSAPASSPAPSPAPAKPESKKEEPKPEVKKEEPKAEPKPEPKAAVKETPKLPELTGPKDVAPKAEAAKPK